jgi:hypothetical protein
MKSSEPSGGRTLGIERLARKMYEESDAARVKPWLRLGWSVRESWLGKARDALDAPGSTLDRFHLWRIVRLFS